MTKPSELLKNFLQNHCANKNIFIGFSGGLDSHVLLHLTAKYRFDIPFNLFAIHVNHNLNLAADQWQMHCEQIANDFAHSARSADNCNRIKHRTSPKKIGRTKGP